jgi:hypothetical protein
LLRYRTHPVLCVPFAGSFCPPTPQNVVFVLAQQFHNLDNGAVRLIHRQRPREDSLEEGECYDHSYGEHVSDHVEVVRLEPARIRVEIPVEVQTEHHVTTERLKGQFEERLAARGARRSRRARP